MRFEQRLPNDTATLLLLSIFLIALLGLSDQVGDRASQHQVAISVVGAICLLVVYGAWLFGYLRSDVGPSGRSGEPTHAVLPFPWALAPARDRRRLGGARLGVVRRRDRPGRRRSSGSRRRSPVS